MLKTPNISLFWPPLIVLVTFVCQVLQPVCHTRALQLWTAVYLPTSSPCTAVDESVELYLPPCVTEELTSRSLDRYVCLVNI